MSKWKQGLIAIVLSAAACGPAPGEATEDSLESDAYAATSFQVTGLRSEVNCMQMRVEFSAAPSVPGKSLRRYEIQRTRKVGSAFTTYTTVSTASATASFGYDAHFLPNEFYYYRVLPIYVANGVESSGTVSAAASITADCTVPRATSGATHQIEVYLFTPSDVAAPADLSRQTIESRLFAESNATSLFNFMQDTSAGVGHTALIPQVRIAGTVRNWQKLAKKKADYPNGLSDMREETRELFLSLYAANPSPIYLFIFNSGAGGGESGNTWITLGAEALKFGPGIGPVAHELGHSLGLRHEIALNCPGGPLPELLQNIETTCTTATYASFSNVMSGANSSSPNYYNGVQKRRLGFLGPQNVSWLDTRTLSVGSSVDFSLTTSTTKQTNNALQLLLLKFDESDTAYALQYRTAAGFDTNSQIGSQIKPFPAGVFVYFAPGRNLDSVVSTTAALLHRGPAGTYTEPVVVTESADTKYYDAFRKIEISVTSKDNVKANVRVKRQ